MSSREVTPRVSPACPEISASEAARELLEAVLAGKVTSRHLEALARAVLEADERVRLALEVLELGPHAKARALELAEKVLDVEDLVDELAGDVVEAATE